uniref:ENHANCER OF AG-4 protein 2-like isoform X2 n=1 Tax=Cicer arietinum TaxID=3827 RepID=A0A3Q7X075_CICAR|nr:ENHANCER OF AG-4 protein 2-like isoform X2 [Cicer arietinum]
MPPSRRRGANKAKANAHLTLGDLVLAKVKGFPAWPAKISRPEDWEKTPDSKKFFVQFYGTEEIAFVAPVDIQAFTNEVKAKLTARCQGKTKCFTRAVKEICAAFEELEKQKAGGMTDDTDDSHFGSEAPSFDGAASSIKDATDVVVLNAEKAKTIMEDVGSNLDHYAQICGESDGQDEKLSASGRPTDSSSPVLSPVLESKSSIGTELTKHSNKSGLQDQSCLKKEVSDFEDVYNVNDFKEVDIVQNVPTNGNKARKLVNGSRRRSEAEADKEIRGFNIAVSKGKISAGYANLSRSRETVKGGKNACFVDSADALKSDSDLNSGNKYKNLLKAKTSLEVKNESQEIFVDSKEAARNNSFKRNKTQVQGKRTLGTNETLHATKKFKCMDAKDNKTLKSLPEDTKSASPDFPVVATKKFKCMDAKDNKTLKSLPEDTKSASPDFPVVATKKFKCMDAKDNKTLKSLPEDTKSASPDFPVVATKKFKCMDAKDNKTLKSLPEDTKSASPDFPVVATKKFKCMDAKDNKTLKSLPEDTKSASPDFPVVATKKFKCMDAKDNKTLKSLPEDTKSASPDFPVVATKKFKCMDAKDNKTLKSLPEDTKSASPDFPVVATKKFKCMDAKDNKTLKSLPEDTKSASPDFPVVDDKVFKKTELKRSVSCLKTNKGLSFRAQTTIVDSNDSVCEVLAGTKHRSQVQQAKPHSVSLSSDEHAEMSSLSLKGDVDNLAVNQVRRRRRAVCLSDDDEPKTPVHGGAAKNIKSPSLVSEVVKSNDAFLGNGDVSQLANRKPSVLEDSHLKGPLTKLCNDSLSTKHPQKENADDEVVAVHLPHSPEKLDSKCFPSNMENISSISPVNSPRSLPTTKSNAERHKSSKTLPKVFSNATPKKADNGPSKSLTSISSLQSQGITHKKKLVSSVERSKTTPKTLPQSIEVHATTESLKELDAIHADRLECGTEEKSSLYAGSRTPETSKTMKHLIAVAQAKRRLVAQFQCHPFDLHNAQVGTPSPSIVKPFLSVSSNYGQANMQGVYEQQTLASPSTNGHHSTPQNQLDAEENEEKRVGSGQRAVGGSLSGGTESAIARDAFEGMIETLSRTKESIGRATRLAIDCAKYGIANEVVELLIRKLENETSFHRKVDLFFLVDSITQCSHNQKGIAGASYIPTIQGGLARLLGAAAPPGTSARENRRQCLKVLRLWLERKIFPESVLRRYLNDIGGSSDDMTVSFSFRRPCRAERSIDDPIRELEGMLVDEYGSNASFQLPGFLSSHVFEEDEDNDFLNNVTPEDPTRTLVDSETSTVTQSDKRHRILEDVDGELEMEDVSGHSKDEMPVLLNSSLEIDFQLQGSEMILDPESNVSGEVHVILEGSPPLPLDSPPPLPPLPSSPPPPPLSASPLPPLPPTLQDPPPPPMPPPGPLPLLIPQSSHQSSTLSGYQQLHNCSGTTSGIQIVQMAGNSFPGGQNSSIVKNEVLPQPSACFPPMAGCSSQEPSALNPTRQLEYGQNDVYLNSQVPLPNQQFQLGNPHFAPRHMNPTPPQNPSNQYSYPKPSVQQHLPHSFYPSYSLTSVPDGQRQFVANEQWRMPTSEFKINNQHGLWRGINPSCPGPPFGQEDYFRPSLERPPISNVGFQHVNPGSVPVPPSKSGYGIPQMFPCRPDIPAVNCWRPT